MGRHRAVLTMHGQAAMGGRGALLQIRSISRCSFVGSERDRIAD